jgi:hypothetical protein
VAEPICLAIINIAVSNSENPNPRLVAYAETKPARHSCQNGGSGPGLEAADLGQHAQRQGQLLGANDPMQRPVELALAHVMLAEPMSNSVSNAAVAVTRCEGAPDRPGQAASFCSSASI